jgi:large subunit ribosomal protein L34e
MRGMYRSRSLKRRSVKAVKRTRQHFKRKKEGVPVCAECGAVLHGVTRKRKPTRPSRTYGGYLCHKCLKEKLVESVRK